jgi:hypothetical protein
MEASYAIGWDVGGWNCDRNPHSRDAIVILDGNGTLAGTPWRGNLRALINESVDGETWIAGLFQLCETPGPPPGTAVYLGIDTPLTFAKAFHTLLHGRPAPRPIGDSHSNPYLYRFTERALFARGLRPLSPVKDMIGSQATKGMHALARFAPRSAGTGVWTDGRGLVALEAYPSVARRSPRLTALRSAYPPLENADKDDALLCALLAHLYRADRAALWPPPPEAPPAEGWIWVPADALSD